MILPKIVRSVVGRGDGELHGRRQSDRITPYKGELMNRFVIVFCLVVLSSCRDFPLSGEFGSLDSGVSIEQVDYSMEADGLRLYVDMSTQIDTLFRSSVLLEIQYLKLMDMITVGSLRISNGDDGRTAMDITIDFAEFGQRKEEFTDYPLSLPDGSIPLLCEQMPVGRIVPFIIGGFSGARFYVEVDENRMPTGIVGYAFPMDETKMLNAGFVPDTYRAFEMDGTTTCLGSYFSPSGESGMAFFVMGS